MKTEGIPFPTTTVGRVCMATKGKDTHLLSEHPILAKLLTEGGPDVKAYRGYVGASGREGHLAIYPSLADLGKSFEIRQSDILHVEEIPEAFAPFGAIMVWVRADADVAARAVATTTGMAQPTQPTGSKAGTAVSACCARHRSRPRAPQSIPVRPTASASPPAIPVSAAAAGPVTPARCRRRADDHGRAAENCR